MPDDDVPPPPRSVAPAAEVARAYVEAHPSVREALRDGLLNYAALARKIQAELGTSSAEALTVACARYQRSGLSDPPGLDAVRRVVESSRLEVRSRVALLRMRDDWSALDNVLGPGRRAIAESGRGRLFEVLQGTRAVTILCEEDLLGTLLDFVPAPVRLGVETGLSVLVFRSRPEVAETPGVMAFLSEELYRRGVNALESVCVHAESILVFRDRDLIPAFTALSQLMGQSPKPTGHPRGAGRTAAKPSR
ncbi:MAG TPA: hypothetical protein VFF67_07585 [Thermoplasmata archaeon]|nr:hypothetical protein [Thermoplasmata archaeon]